MKAQAGPDLFWPYDSADDIYCDKVLPDYGLSASKWQFPLNTWRFYHAENRDLVPVDFASYSCNDGSWDEVTLPSVWQQEGYGLPSDLMYHVADKEEQGKLRSKLSAKMNSLANSDYSDDVGVYRAWIAIPADYLERAIYFSCAGIRGRFEVYVNGNFVLKSSAIYETNRILLSPYLSGEDNLITILVYRLDADKHGKIRIENGTFGFSGIFRVPEILAETLVEMSGIRITTSFISEAFANEAMGVLSDTSSQVVKNDDDRTVIEEGNNNRKSRSARIHVDLSFHNHTDIMIPIRVSCEIYEARAEYDLYNLPLVRTSVVQGISGRIPALSDSIFSGEMYASGILPWSDQKPALYDLVLTLFDVHDRIICVKRKRFGFRDVEAIGKIMHMNDYAIPIRAVRYYSFDPVTGIAVSAERILQDILLMKQANLNTVIVMHYSYDPILYTMCDQYGLFVITQARHTHMLQAIESLQTHPSIVLWSFPSLHFDEGKMWHMKQQLIQVDPSRPFYCEKDKGMTVSDIPMLPCEAGTVFGDWMDLCLDKRNLLSKKGKGLFSGISGRAVRKDDATDYQFLHQGDLEEYHEKKDIPIAQGIVRADRVVHPYYFEMKKQCETLQMIPSPDTPARLTLYNLHPYGETNHLILYWQLLLGGYRIRGGSGKVTSLPPLGVQELCFPFSVSDYLSPDWAGQDASLQAISEKAIARELVLDIRVCLDVDMPYVRAGHEIAFYQQVILEQVAVTSKTAPNHFSSELQLVSGNPKLKVLTKPSQLIIVQNAWSVAFSRSGGGLSSISFFDREYLSGNFMPSFFRAATNSDRSDKSFVLAATIFSQETDWRTIQAGLSYHRFTYEMIQDTFVLVVFYKNHAFKEDVMVQYTMEPSGKLSLEVVFTPRYDLLRGGFRVKMNRAVNKLIWYGRGIHESYPDRKESARLGRYESTPEEMYFAYARPQENGAHCDTSYLIVSDGTGKGIKVTAGSQNPFIFTAAMYSPEVLDDSQHQEVMFAQEYYELFLDFYQRGIERTGKETRQFVKNQTYRGSFSLEPWIEVRSEP